MAIYSRFKAILFSTLIIINTPSLAAKPVLTQIIITLTNNGGSSKIFLPLNAEININAAHVEQSPDKSEIHATGQVAIEVKSKTSFPLTITGTEAILKKRTVSQEQLADRAKLESLLQLDQNIRQRSLKRALSSEEIAEQSKIDQRNRQFLTKLINKYGWPGIDFAGLQGADTAFLILQHADLATQEKYLEIFRQAVKEGNAWPSQLAMLEDRVNIRNNKPQLYGTQFHFDDKGIVTPDPIADPEHVDQRRRAVGLIPLAEYLNLFVAPSKS